MKHRTITTLTTTLALIASATTLAQPSTPPREPAVNLAPDLTTEREHTYDLSITARQTIRLLGQDNNTNSSMDASLNVAIEQPTEDEDAHAVAILTFTRIAVDFEGSPILRGTFDSNTPAANDDPNDRLAQAVRPMVNKPVRLLLEADGTIDTVTGLDNMSPRGEAGFIFQRLFGPDTLTRMIQPIFAVKPLPDSAEASTTSSGRLSINAAIGESWSAVVEEAASLSLPQADITLTLDKHNTRGSDADNPLESGTAIIDIEGKPEARIPDGADALPTKVTSATLDGDLTWDAATGILKDLNSTALVLIKADGQFEVEIELESKTILNRTD